MQAGHRRLTVLITGFGPFPGAPSNPTEALVARLLRRRRPAFAELRLVGHVFRTAYADVDAQMPSLLARHRPDVVLMFGLARRTRFIRIETCARNVRPRLLVDAGGSLPAQQRLQVGDCSFRRGRAPFAALRVAARTAGGDVRLSHDAGRYVCNYLYWKLASQRHAAPRLFVFVHVPWPRQRRPLRRRRNPRPHADHLLRAAELMLQTLIAAARKR